MASDGSLTLEKRLYFTSPPPTTLKQVQEFLGMAGFCRLWMPDFAKLAAPLYPLTKSRHPFLWGEREQQDFDSFKLALMLAPTLGLPDVTKPFIAENRRIVKGVQTQTLGPWSRPIAYLSKKIGLGGGRVASLSVYCGGCGHDSQRCR